jgi:pyruvate kinase
MPRNVKILATLGPASSSKEMIRALVDAGANAFRLNMGHGSHEEAAEKHRFIREIEEDLGYPIAILADLQGPKLRVGVFADGPVDLEEGATFQLDLDEAPGDATRVQLPHLEIFEALVAGASLLVNDGKIRLRVDKVSEGCAVTTVIVGGEISDRKGVNVPDVVLPLAALTDKDRRDLEFACELGVDWLALSFVQRLEDVLEAKDLCRGRAAIIAKIEKPAAVEAIDAIIEVSDAIMVARGDLGVELPVAEVPPVQKRLVELTRNAGKPVVVATQMLESMITAPVPTRAEVSDVANAIYDGADAVMLSAESAAGAYPQEAVRTMDEVARRVEVDARYRSGLDASRAEPTATVEDAIAAAAREVAETVNVSAICTFTTSGATAMRVARERPRVPIAVITPFVSAARRLSLSWGLQCAVSQEAHEFHEAVDMAFDSVREMGLAVSGDRIVVTAGVPFNIPGSTNVLRVADVP